MEAKELIERARNSVVDQAYVKGCPNSPQEWVISTEKLIPLQEMAIFKAGIRVVVEWGEERCQGHKPHGLFGALMGMLPRRACGSCWQAKLKEWGIE